MAITIDWLTYIINVPKADMLLVQSNPVEIRELDIDAFRLELKSIEDDPAGMAQPTTHTHVAPISVGGVTLARVIEMLAPYTVTFEDGQYAVNLVGANSNIGDVINVNQVSVRSANSAGLTYSKEVEDQSFTDSRVWIDTVDGVSGTQFPRGTPGDPVDNFDDAETIIGNRNLPRRLNIVGSLSGSLDLASHDIQGYGQEKSQITLVSGSDTAGLKISGVFLTGEAAGGMQINGHSHLSDLTELDAHVYDCGISGTLALAASATDINLIGCYSEVAGPSTPVLDCSSAADLSINVRGYNGGLEIQSFDQPSGLMTVDLASGHLVLDASCSDGTIVVRGVGHVTDNSSGATVITTGLVEGEQVREMWRWEGLESGAPMTVTPTSRSAAGISADLSGDGVSSTTVTRQ